MDDHPGVRQSSDKRVSIDIFTVLGHDLKSPLSAVESYLEIILNRVLGDGLDPYMPILENSIARLHQMRELITDVVDWSKIQQPSSSRSLSAMDASKTVRRILDGYVKEAQGRNITVSADIEDGLTMKAASNEIELIVRHLVDNAIKYNRDNGSVRITLKRAGPNIALNVADTGIGMTAEEQARLFVEFVRIKNSQTQDIKGTGLGLAIMKKLIALYQGTVSVESEPNIGTTFSVILACG
jgi:two-component system phosphate regulon sensor histidine kinase PhoR